MKSKVLIEIGTEELPFNFINSALEELYSNVEKALLEERLNFDKLSTFATPRRLVIYIEGVKEKGEDKVLQIKGPPKSVAFTEDGTPTKAALSFAKSRGVKVEELFCKKLETGEYVFAKLIKEGKTAKEILAKIIPEVILKLNLPKGMRWDESQIRFSRPIRWILALLGEEVIPFKLGKLESKRFTLGHRVAYRKPVEIKSVDNYFDLLKKHFVIVDHMERLLLLRDRVSQLTAELKAELIEPNDLEKEINFLVEHPLPFYGTFPKRYLSLPSEVLITVMKKHQKYFPLRDKKGKLLPGFICVSNCITPDVIPKVRNGNEQVLIARLADAEFFFKEDLKLPLAERRGELKGIVFHQNLGSMEDKICRMERLFKQIKEEIKGVNYSSIIRAIALCKIDMATDMVGEFPELKGIMGGIYAKHSGETEEVVKAISEHYLPQTADDLLPSTLEGEVVSLLDKIDSIVAFWAKGFIPTGSSDPYGVRRLAIAVLRLLWQGKVKLNLKNISTKALEILREDRLYSGDDAKVLKELEEFLYQRWENMLTEEGLPYDIIRCAKREFWQDIKSSFNKIQALADFKTLLSGKEALTALLRIINIINKEEALNSATYVKEELLLEEAERELYKEFYNIKKLGNKILNASDEVNYKDFLHLLIILAPKINKFFDEVMVMVNKEELKLNRLSLLKEISSYFSIMGNFSQIVI